MSNIHYVADCKACGGTVAMGAKTCPHCGCKKPSAGQVSDQPITHFLIGFVFIIAVFIWVFVSNL
ncbi:MAG: hypothetical protein GWN01_12145 [Nitrosopumilaceae archaeon]|nr:hypothetical protein [Nitrosopumilaceae archaeon]NIU88045.1 hypothetical protein [Nitrosopumilaceae archaeon]NIX62229.1 hypothetical protein [Nitrosopumilaceae archaeon]